MKHAWPAALLAAALLPALVHANDGRKQFGRWAANCAKGAYCTASTRLTGGGDGYAYQLRVSRFASGTQEVVFLPASAAPAADSPLQISVDRKPPLTLAPGSGYRRVGSSSTFVLAGDAVGPLLRAMHGGQQVTFAYTGAAGKPVQISFPLLGLPQALKFAGVAVPADQPAATAQAASAETAKPAAQKPARRDAARRGPDQPAASSAAAAVDAQKEDRAAPASPAAAASPPVPAVTQAAAEEAPRTVAPAPHGDSAASTPPAAPPAARASTAPDAGERTDAAPKPVATQSAAARPAAATTVARKRTKAVTQFACRGNEPAWSLVIDRDTARYLALQGSEPQAVPLKGKLKVTGEGRTPDVDWRGKSDDGGSYKVLIQEQACADTMADAGEGQGTFAYRARLTLPNGKLVQGCCHAGLETVAQAQPAATPAALPGAAARLDPPKLEQASVNLEQAPVAQLFAKRPDDWSRFLLELKPAIDACLDRTPGGAAYVTKAWPMNRGLVGVRTRNGGAGWFDCVAEYDGRSVQRFDPVTAEAGPVPGEGNVLYTPITSTPLQGKCWRQERVVDGGGTALGWLSSNGC
jgi:uncharacterized membrane protein